MPALTPQQEFNQRELERVLLENTQEFLVAKSLREARALRDEQQGKIRAAEQSVKNEEKQRNAKMRENLASHEQQRGVDQGRSDMGRKVAVVGDTIVSKSQSSSKAYLASLFINLTVAEKQQLLVYAKQVVSELYDAIQKLVDAGELGENVFDVMTEERITRLLGADSEESHERYLQRILEKAQTLLQDHEDDPSRLAPVPRPVSQALVEFDENLKKHDLPERQRYQNSVHLLSQVSALTFQEDLLGELDPSAQAVISPHFSVLTPLFQNMTLSYYNSAEQVFRLRRPEGAVSPAQINAANTVASLFGGSVTITPSPDNQPRLNIRPRR